MGLLKAATIQFQRPELHFPAMSKSISLNPPFGYFKAMDIPNVGDLMAPSFPIGVFDVSASPTKWWLGEKYDGVRYCWHPTLLRAFGKVVELPPKITRRLASIFLDGEFWFGRGCYHFTSPLVSDSVDLVSWDLFRMIPFDIPSPNFENKPFEERYKALLQHVGRHHPFSVVAPRVFCAGNLHLSLYVHGIINDGGEGAVMRAFKSLYERARSPSLLKLKTASGDKEAIVVEVDPRNSVTLKLPHGVTFSVPVEDVRVPSVAVGDVVSFSYETYSRRDVPVNPTIYRIRTDLSWQEVLYSSMKDEKFLSNRSVVGFTTQPPNHWTKENMRKFMENAARAQHLDPLRAETWYSIPVSYIYQITSGRMIMQKLKGYFNALQYLFPEVKFDKNSFARSNWIDIENRRSFFENYAQENDFDPLIPQNWYSQPVEKFTVIKGLKNLLSYHKNSITQAIIDLFPNIGLVESEFQPHYVYWNSVENRRKFFEDFAKEEGFDVQNKDSWYSFPQEKIMAKQEARRVLQYHGFSVSRALTELFPQIGFESDKFVPLNSFQTPAKRRRLFENFAKRKGFDPLVAENWYMCSTKDIEAMRGILSYHKYSFIIAVTELFPELSFDKSKFFLNIGWKSTQKQRKFFENYAKQRKFDPLNPHNWYSKTKKDILKMKGAAGLLRHYGDKLPAALVELFPEIGIDKTKFVTQRWTIPENRRKFFVDFAKENHFEPLKPENWYSQQRQRVVELPGAYGVLSHHNNSLSQALVDLFPDVEFDILKFPVNTLWSDRSERRKFFEKYASKHGFDPLNPFNWYSVSRASVLAAKGGAGLLSYYDNNLREALVDIFTEVDFNHSLFDQ